MESSALDIFNTLMSGISIPVFLAVFWKAARYTKDIEDAQNEIARLRDKQTSSDLRFTEILVTLSKIEESLSQIKDRLNRVENDKWQEK